ncbi:hypothetical protein [Planktothrix mougeotii]|uniref:Uncharacterized protein n=1 Tax=Planktothrix mougeotii LEGE 06226 TaxID=1828728 RepID=A0ABR9UI12_9CYAN|nr:hypothetical protein [Planktothrix mougeotii]MBE9145214.1 hypothetical protein [Planktothrix mougeotii LEGE 06226]
MQHPRISPKSHPQFKKSNFESVLDRQINVTITLGDKNNRNKNTVNIGSLNSCPATSSITSDQTQVETIGKLRQFGLSDEQIAEALMISLENLS